MSWFVFVMMMAAASAIGLGFLDNDHVVARPLVTVADASNPSAVDHANDALVLAAIETAALVAPAGGSDDPQQVLARPGKAHAPANTSVDDWQTLVAAKPLVDDVAAAMIIASNAWSQHYDEAEEPNREQVEEASIQPVPVPSLPGDNTLPVIAIVIDDLGLNRSQTAAVAELPSPITMAFIPYAEDLVGQTQRAHANGHEIFLHLPMEPIDPSKNPGPNALLASLTPDELRERLVENLDRFTGYVGVNNHMGSRLTQDSEAMSLVMTELKHRGLLFLDSLTIGSSVAYQTAELFGVPSAKRDIFLDNDPDVEAILRQLYALEAVASREGSAIAIGHPYGATVAALTQWIPDALARGFRIVPASDIIDQRSLVVAQHANVSTTP